MGLTAPVVRLLPDCVELELSVNRQCVICLHLVGIDKGIPPCASYVHIYVFLF